MALGKVRTDSFDTATGPTPFFAVNKRQEVIVIDFWTQLVLEGRVFHVQIGTESAPVNTTTSIDDELVWTVVDTNPGTIYMPTYVDVWAAASTATGETLVGMLEVDRAQNRYDSAGLAYVPENMRTDRPRPSTATCYVMHSTDDAGIVVSAKTAVPGSMEIGHKAFYEDTAGSTNEPVDFVMNMAKLYSVMEKPAVAIADPGSMIVHFGAGTADETGYGIVEWAELPATAAK